MNKLLYLLILVCGSYFVATLMKGATLKESAHVQSDEIIGEWVETDSDIPYKDIGILELKSRTINFNENGTYTYKDKVKYTQTQAPSKVMHFVRQSIGHWELKNNTLISRPNARVVTPIKTDQESLQLAEEWSVSALSGSFEEKIIYADINKIETWSKEFKEKRLYERN